MQRGTCSRYGVPAQVNEAGGLKAFLFHRGFKQKLRYLDQGYAYDKVLATPVCPTTHIALPEQCCSTGSASRLCVQS